MGLYDKSQALNPGIFIEYFILIFLGHSLLLNRASLPWRGTKPIRHTETCPGFLMRPQFTEHIRFAQCKLRERKLYGRINPEDATNRSI